MRMDQGHTRETQGKQQKTEGEFQNPGVFKEQLHCRFTSFTVKDSAQ